MMELAIIPFDEGEKGLDWIALTEVLEAGHALPKASVEDVFLYRGDDTLLNRSACIDGLGFAVKAATVFPGNKNFGKSVIGGAVNLFSDSDGSLEAILDFHLVTKWKTAGDSLMAARKLARPDSQRILIVGAGTVGRSLWQAYRSAFPNARFQVWNRSPEGAKAFLRDCPGTEVAHDLAEAVSAADIVTSATMSTTPLIHGEWLRPGQHIDLIGAYRPDMREVDDLALQRARIFVDNFHTTVEHIGELKIPVNTGAITRDEVLADYYDVQSFQRGSDDEITLFKNGGGAHLDLMTCRYILDNWRKKDRR